MTRPADRRSPSDAPPAAATVSVDHLLDGRIELTQPTDGYRVAIDPVLLAAAVPAKAGDRVLDLGAGTGAASLCLAHRVAGCNIVAMERAPEALDLARRNIVANGCEDRVAVRAGNLADGPGEGWGSFDHVLANPPFNAVGTGTAPPARKYRAMVEDDTPLADWLAAMIAAIRAKGTLTLIHRTDRLDEILAALAGRTGDIAIFPLWPKFGKPARRVIVAARRGTRGPVRLLPGLVLHEADDRFAQAADAVLRDGRAIDLWHRAAPK